MKAIITKYHGPTNTRGSRIRASDLDGNRVTVSFDHALNGDGNHDAAAVALCRKMGWSHHNLMRGGLGGGDVVYTFEADCNRVKVS